MSSEFPRLQKKLDAIVWELDQKLQELKENQLKDLEDIELIIDQNSFSRRSPISNSAYHLRQKMSQCWNDFNEEIINSNSLDEEHIFAAKGLIKLGKYQDAAIKFLTKILILDFDTFRPMKKTKSNAKQIQNDMSNPDAKPELEPESEKKKLRELRKLASEVLSDCNKEILELSIDPKDKATKPLNDGDSCTLSNGKTGVIIGGVCTR